MTSLVCPSRAPLVSAPGKARPGAISMRRAPRLIEQLRCQAKDGGGAAPGAAARTAATPPPLPPVVNWHLEARCNYACKFCFATFEDVKEAMKQGEQGCSLGSDASVAPSVAAGPTDEQLMAVPRLLAEQGASRLSFVGGEPLLHPRIHELVSAAKAAGLATSMVTNASLLTPSALLRLAGSLDWLALSLDASSDALHAAVGRGVRGELAAGGSAHLRRVRQVWGQARELGFQLKLNTVVTRATLEDDMAPLVVELQPARWKVFQVLPVEGQNNGAVDALLISAAEYGGWVERHRASLARLASTGSGPVVHLVAESNEDMRGSYAMLEPACRFFSNASGAHVYGRPIFDGEGGQGDVAAAWASVSAGGGFSGNKFAARGGVYDWGQGRDSLAAQMEHWGPGASVAAGQRQA